MTFEQVLYEKSDGVATITLNRPERMNAFTDTMIREWAEAVEDARVDRDVRAVIVTGAGRAFCAGADLSDPGGPGGRANFDAPAASGAAVDDLAHPYVERGDESVSAVGHTSAGSYHLGKQVATISSAKAQDSGNRLPFFEARITLS